MQFRWCPIGRVPFPVTVGKQLSVIIILERDLYQPSSSTIMGYTWIYPMCIGLARSSKSSFFVHVIAGASRLEFSDSESVFQTTSLPSPRLSPSFSAKVTEII